MIQQPHRNWPRAYLLSLYTAAIEQGMIYAQPIQRDQAQSLKMSLYRLRRRSDSSNSSFITADHHLVTVGDWEEIEDGQGRLPIMFTKADFDLPAIVGASGDEIAGAAHAIAITAAHTLDEPTEAALNLAMDESGVSDYVAKMVAAATARTEGVR
jgi:hypothetical protein